MDLWLNWSLWWQACRLRASSRGRTAPFLHNMRFAVFIACPLDWKVTRELRDYSLTHSVTVWSRNPETGFGSHRLMTTHLAESLTCFACLIRALDALRRGQCITSRSARVTNETNFNGENSSSTLVTT